jgi:NADPH:quinone reductase-like Zn-dependent oxidoreductase
VQARDPSFGARASGATIYRSRMAKNLQVVVTARESAELVQTEIDGGPLGPTEVMGTTLASVISPGTELNGMYLADEFPKQPGYAACFRVDRVGEKVTCVKPGDRAFCMGKHQSQQRFDQADVLKVPDNLNSEHAVFARLMGVSMASLTTVTARSPERVLVTGLGPVGYLAAAIFAMCGYDVIAADPEAPRREALNGVPGIRMTVDHADPEDPELKDRVAVVVECSGHEQAALDGCKIVRKGGEVVLIGAPWTPRTKISAFDLLHPIFFRYVTLRTGWEWELPMHTTDFRHNSIWSNYSAALRWLSEGRIKVDHLYETRSPREANQAYQDLMHHRLEELSIVFDWTKVS